MDIFMYTLHVLTQIVLYLIGTSQVKAVSFHTMLIDPTYDVLRCYYSDHFMYITNITINHRPTKCMESRDDTCTVSDEAKEEIKKTCDGHNECQLNVTKLTDNNCFQEYGFFKYERHCHVEVLGNCDFDPNFRTCNFKRSEYNKQFRWWRRTGHGAVPSSDHTQGGKRIYAYLFIGNESYIQYNHTAVLKYPYTVSDESRVSKPRCLVFWLYMNETKHLLYVIDGNGQTVFETLSNNPSTSAKWIEHRVTLPSAQFSFKVSYRNERFDGVIAIDDSLLLDGSCEESKPVNWSCYNIADHQYLPSCYNPNNVSIAFDPDLKDCTEVYQNISHLVSHPCIYPNESSNCRYNLKAEIDRNAYCFRKRDISIEFECDAIQRVSKIIQEKNEKISPGTIASIVVGMLVVCAGFGFVWLLYRRHGTEKKDESSPQLKLSENNEYTNCQNVDKSLVKASSHFNEPHDNAQYMNTQFKYDNSAPLDPIQKNGGNKTTENEIRKDKTHLFSNSGRKRVKGQTEDYYELANQIINNEHFDENYEVAKQISNDAYGNEDGKTPSTDEAYMVLDKSETGYDHGKRVSPINSYEFAKPVENGPGNEDDYINSIDSEYVISRSNVHKEQDNVYSHCVDSVYDSAGHCHKDNNLDDNYDHFDASVTDDDYNISQH